MKKVNYDKSRVMKEAWEYFYDGCFEVCDMRYVADGDKTFAACLKEAWGREKELVDSRNKMYEDAEHSEEAKAWDWACRKLGVNFDDEMNAWQKMRDVEDMYKEVWPGTSVWGVAMRAVKLHIELVERGSLV